MDLGVRSKFPVRRPRSQLRKGWVYTRHSLRFEVVHPVVAVLALLQIVVSVALYTGSFAAALFLGPSAIEPVVVGSTILSYVLTSVTTVLLNGTIAGYVLAVELGVRRPLSRATGQVRDRLAALVGYAVVWAAIVTTFVLLDRVARSGVLVEPLNVALQVGTFGMNLAWTVGTIFVVPILVFEPTTSLRRAIRRSSTFLAESVVCLLVFWAVGAAIFVSIVGGGVAFRFLTPRPIAGVAPVLAVFVGSFVCYTLSTVFNSLLYGEVAGPLDIDGSRMR